MLDSQGEVVWEVPPGAPDELLLFQTSSAHLHKNSLTFLGGEHGWSLTFKVLICVCSTHKLVCVSVCLGER